MDATLTKAGQKLTPDLLPLYEIIICVVPLARRAVRQGTGIDH